MKQPFILLFALTLFSPANAQAQSWCPPGATWIYDTSDPMLGASATRFAYVGDTVVDGFAGQRIEQLSAMTLLWGIDTLIISNGPDVVTRTEPGIVYWWMDNVQEWDTLYWFDALPGDRWSPGWQQGSDQWWGTCDDGSYLMVMGTNTTVIEGHSLRTLSVAVAHGGDLVDAFTIVERMGNTQGYFIPRPTYCFVDECYCSFSCYSDDEIHLPFGGPCELPLAVEEDAIANADNWSVSPMPFRDRFTVRSATPRNATVILFDMTGREMLSMPFNGTSLEVYPGLLPAGGYVLRMVDARGTLRHRMVIKE